jgi:galactokinase
MKRFISIIKKHGKKYENLSQIEENDMLLLKQNDLVFRRAKHVFYENRRVAQLKEALMNNNFIEAGILLNQSHESLRDLYEVTCLETDFLFENLNLQKGVLGCRQMGGGFGGCMLILVKTCEIENLKKEVRTNYRNQFNLDVEFYEINISEGCN